MNFSIEPAAVAHLSAIPRIEQAAASMFPEVDLPLRVRYRVTDRRTLSHAQRNGRLWVALNALREPVGYARVCEIDDQAHLDEMDVHPDFGRRGIGTQLLRTVVAWATEQGFDELTLITFRHLPWNAPFYASQGFEVVPRAQLGEDMRDLLRQEAKAGLEATNRVCMRRLLT